MLKGRFSAISFALIIHAAIIFLVSYNLVIPTQKKITPKAINSFLYIPPKPAPPSDPLADDIVEQQQQKKSQKIIDSDKQQTSKEAPEAPAEQTEKSTITQAPATKKQPETPPRTASKKALKFSAIQQLEHLRQQLDQKTIEQQSFEYSQKKSASIMNGQPEPIRHSTTQLSKEEKNEQATYQMSSDLKIIKGNDGTCFIKKDLSTVGIEGVTSVESFSCGQSKFDKSFKAHMKKVLKKLGK
ncbi:hypothetical protein tinsulaeT_11010 [Thalassotalea insulae]|uniref:Energy transducer TonB n=1 Tax=Thalassotalea insulae TaxID=2056778 RepID=A0ABQ6GSV6_9GAMM|nr:hypothetical protein [Thalassotalea insulae]GLX77761.1 hypothetical protein tinsulaeT_11010 [Thalassotalea insulae]